MRAAVLKGSFSSLGTAHIRQPRTCAVPRTWLRTSPDQPSPFDAHASYAAAAAAAFDLSAPPPPAAWCRPLLLMGQSETVEKGHAPSGGAEGLLGRKTLLMSTLVFALLLLLLFSSSSIRPIYPVAMVSVGADSFGLAQQILLVALAFAFAAAQLYFLFAVFSCLPSRVARSGVKRETWPGTWLQAYFCLAPLALSPSSPFASAPFSTSGNYWEIE